MVKLAMEQYVQKLESDLKRSLAEDNRSELNKSFQIYRKLD